MTLDQFQMREPETKGIIKNKEVDPQLTSMLPMLPVLPIKIRNKITIQVMLMKMIRIMTVICKILMFHIPIRLKQMVL